eukprot:jgi/Psemu1/248273/estExt_Genewise1.C_16850002
MFSELMDNTSSDTGATSLISVIVGADQIYLESAFNSNEGFRSFFLAMTRYLNSANVQESGCALLAEIYFHLPYPLNGVETLQGPWAPQSQREALAILNRAMNTHGDNVNVQINGGNLLDRQSISLVIELSYSVVLDCLHIHESDTNLQRSGLSALAVSIRLENHVENSDVVSAILDVLCTCCDRDDHFKNYLLEENRARMIINTMQLNLGSIGAQLNGCNLFSILSNFGNGKERIGKYGGIPTIINALLAHNDSTGVQRKGLVALKNLATAPANKPIINDMGGESSVIYALWINYRNPEVVSIGLSALNNIAVDPVTRSVAKMNEQAIIIVVAAMRNFPMDECVQKNACFYLKTCSYLPENVQMMCEQSEDLLPLLLQAGESFPDHCLNRANAVITKITTN